MLHVRSAPDDFPAIEKYLAGQLVNHAPTVEVGEVHAQKVDHPLQQFRELLNVSFDVLIRSDMMVWQDVTRPNLPWAEDHFRERVNGEPLNPPPSHIYWPFAVGGNAEHTGETGAFSHSYPERFWPKFANVGGTVRGGRQVFVPHVGLRFEYGDLHDLVEVLQRNLMSRQAFLPVWFPEDLVAAQLSERVPCTLGYHFIYRHTLQCTYYMRSCDFVRFFRDDVYMAGRLTQWIAHQLRVSVGKLNVHIVNLHCFEGDVPKLRRDYGFE